MCVFTLTPEDHSFSGNIASKVAIDSNKRDTNRTSFAQDVSHPDIRLNLSHVMLHDTKSNAEQ